MGQYLKYLFKGYQLVNSSVWDYYILGRRIGRDISFSSLDTGFSFKGITEFFML